DGASSANKMADGELNVDSLITRLLEVNFVQMTEAEVQGLCIKSRENFLSQPIILELEGPLKICGGIHGQYTDLLCFPPEANYLFLGDYVDRGKQSLETICLLLAYKIKYPGNFFLLRAAIVDEKIFCCHGRLLPGLQSMEQIWRIMRPTEVPDTGQVCSVICCGLTQTRKCKFGKKMVIVFPSLLELLSLLIRWWKMDMKSLLTPNYFGKFDNAGGMMSVDETLMCSFQILKSSEKKAKNQYGGLSSGHPVTPP
ncbi:hypothetical protein E2I00_000046, partial [Balaenoptera physalus]